MQYYDDLIAAGFDEREALLIAVYVDCGRSLDSAIQTVICNA